MVSTNGEDIFSPDGKFFSNDLFGKTEPKKKVSWTGCFSYIYEIRNKHQNKAYVGCTTKDFTKRWHDHFFLANEASTIFREETLKSNLTDWTFSILETIPLDSTKTEQELIDISHTKETFWINKLNTYLSGYNMKVGGSGVYKKKET